MSEATLKEDLGLFVDGFVRGYKKANGGFAPGKYEIMAACSEYDEATGAFGDLPVREIIRLAERGAR